MKQQIKTRSLPPLNTKKRCYYHSVLTHLAEVEATALTGVHDWLPLVTPFTELLGVLSLHASSLLETRHDVITGLEGVLCSLYGALIVPRLPGQKERGATVNIT